MKLAEVVEIKDIQPIVGADRIEVISVLGYKVVAQKGLYEVGGLAIYISPDTIVPNRSWSSFLFKGSHVNDEQIRLKVCRLKKQVSQGLLVPLKDAGVDSAEIGDEVTDQLGIIKYEKPIPACLAGEAIGYRPSYIRKTDEDNLRNNIRVLEELQGKKCYIATKVDGSSMSAFFKDGEFGVCSRKMHLEPDPDNSFWKVAKKYDIEEKMRDFGRNICIQGECFGEKIQNNPLKISGQDLRVFDIWDIDQQKYLDFPEMEGICEEMDLPIVDIVWKGIFNFTLDELVEMSNRTKYPCGSVAEGIVIRPVTTFDSDVLSGRCSVKVISENYSLKHGE